MKVTNVLSRPINTVDVMILSSRSYLAVRDDVTAVGDSVVMGDIIVVTVNLFII
jgi:hypothetical protein